MKRIEIIGVDTSSLPKISGEESRQYLLEIKNGNEEKKIVGKLKKEIGKLV